MFRVVWTISLGESWSILAGSAPLLDLNVRNITILLVMFATTPQAPFFQPQPQPYDQNAIQNQHSLRQITASLDAINQLQQQPELQTLLLILRSLQE